MRRALSFFIGTLVGGIIGAAAALLLAPSSGEELRGQIDSRFKNFATDIRQTASSKRIELQTRLETLRTPKP